MDFKKLNFLGLVGFSSVAFAQENAKVTTEFAKAAGDTANEIWSIFDSVKAYFTIPNIASWTVKLLAIFLFYVIFRIIKKLVTKTATRTLQPNTVSVITKIINYTFKILILMYVLSCFGIKLSAIWGAAGIAGVAIGFAAQTSVSNLISGLFVVTDKAMKPGDFIEVSGISGIVDTVGVISVKIHTLDNQMIRIPNSSIINSNLINYSAFPFRRYVFEACVDYSSNIDKALEVLKAVPARCPTVLIDDPEHEPKAVYTTLGESGINMNLIVWCKSPDFFQTKHDVCVNVLKAFSENGINIPYNRIDVSLLSEKTIPSANFKA